MILARRLALEAHRALKLGCPLDQVALALRSFVEQPAPGTFVHATRALRSMREENELTRVLAQQRDRAYQESLGLLRSTGTSGEVLAASLTTGVRDQKAPARLQALACLIGAYEELESRAQQQRDALRSRLGLA